METRTLVIFIDSKGNGTLMENGEIVRDDIPEYELKAFMNHE